MFEVTEAAQKKLAEYFERQEKSPIRVFLNPGG